MTEHDSARFAQHESANPDNATSAFGDIHPSWAQDAEEFERYLAQRDAAPALPTVTEFLEARMRNEIAAIEQAAEQAVTDPRGWGVKVIRYTDGLEVGLSEDVPYGEIHAFELAGPRAR